MHYRTLSLYWRSQLNRQQATTPCETTRLRGTQGNIALELTCGSPIVCCSSKLPTCHISRMQQHVSRNHALYLLNKVFFHVTLCVSLYPGAILRKQRKDAKAWEAKLQDFKRDKQGDENDFSSVSVAPCRRPTSIYNTLGNTTYKAICNTLGHLVSHVSRFSCRMYASPNFLVENDILSQLLLGKRKTKRKNSRPP